MKVDPMTDSVTTNYPTADEIQTWLLGRLSDLLSVPPEDFDVNEPFTSYGLSSTEAISMSGDLADWLKRSVPPTLVYEYPSVHALADYLGNETSFEAHDHAGPPASAESKDPLAAFFVELDEISEVEAQARLMQKLATGNSQ